MQQKDVDMENDLIVKKERRKTLEKKFLSRDKKGNEKGGTFVY
jgi:hypothetical protein